MATVPNISWDPPSIVAGRYSQHEFWDDINGTSKHSCIDVGKMICQEDGDILACFC